MIESNINNITCYNCGKENLEKRKHKEYFTLEFKDIHGGEIRNFCPKCYFKLFPNGLEISKCDECIKIKLVL